MRIIRSDASEAWAVGFQDAGSSMMKGVVELYNNVMYYVMIILVLVLWMMISGVMGERSPVKYIRMSREGGGEVWGDKSSYVEIIWTVTPAIVLMAIALPSLKLLYLMDEMMDPAITVKAVGHQWYWNYEYSDYEPTIKFDSYMKDSGDLEDGELRLLEVDNRVVLPASSRVRVIVTSSDVLHSWAIPSLGVKADAIPGRLNQVTINMDREGIYYGQCSELCGVQHMGMPIAIEGVSEDKYITWLSQWIEENGE